MCVHNPEVTPQIIRYNYLKFFLRSLFTCILAKLLSFSKYNLANKVIESWSQVWVFFPAAPEEVMEVWWERGRDRWAFAFLDVLQYIDFILQVTVWFLVGEKFKQDHPIGKQVTPLVDPSRSFLHYLRRHPVVGSSLISGDSVHQLPGTAKSA